MVKVRPTILVVIQNLVLTLPPVGILIVLLLFSLSIRLTTLDANGALRVCLVLKLAVQ